MISSDQAGTLRNMSHGGKAPDPLDVGTSGHTPAVIAVASGKGGVGKTSLVANLGVALAKAGRNVLAIDGDLGLANLDMAFGMTPERTLLDLVESRATIEEVLAPGPHGLCLLPGCSGRYDLANMSDNARYDLFSAVDTLDDRFDTLLVDTAAGIGSNAVSFAASANTVVVVANPEPTSQADAYAFIKVAASQHSVDRVHLLVNMVRSPAEAEVVFGRLATLADRFLSVSVDYLGYVVRDDAVSRSIHAGVPVMMREPDSPASRCFAQVGRTLEGVARAERRENSGGIRLFWRRLLEGERAQ